MTFKWFQNNSTVTISFPVAATVKKQDVDVYITNSAIRAGIRGTPAVCEGQLCSPIKSSKWALKSNMVVIHLEKVNTGKWPSLFAVGGALPNSKPVVRVTFDYDATDPVELTIREGETITVLNQDPSGWWKGELNGKVGLFPHNFVELLTTRSVVEPPEDMSESVSSIQEEEFTPSQDQTPAGQLQPPQPTASSGTDETRPRIPAGAIAGPLSMDELKNKLKKRAGDEPGSTPSTAPSGSKIFTRPSPGAGDEPSNAPSATPSGSKLFTRPPPGAASSSTEAPVAITTPSTASSGSKLFTRPSPGVADSPEPPPTGSKIFSRPSAEPAASRVNLNRSPAEAAPAATEAPTSGSKLLLRPTAGADPANVDAASSTGGSRLKFGNKGPLGVGAIAAGAITSNVERIKGPSQSTSVAPAVEPAAALPEASVEKKVSKAGTHVRAVYEYEAVDEGEIGFAEGTEIEVLVRDTSGWWQGKLPTGQVGWFPANFIEEIAPPQPEVKEETVAEKLQKASSTAARLATPRRASGNASRRKPTKQKSTTAPPKKVVESTQSPLPVPETKQASNTPTTVSASATSDDSKPRPRPIPRQADEPGPDQAAPTITSTLPPIPIAADNTSTNIPTSTPPPTSAKASAPVRKALPKAAARPMPGPKTESEEKSPTTPMEKLAARPSMPGPKTEPEEKPSATPIEKPVATKATAQAENTLVSTKEKAMPRWPPNLGNYNEFCQELSALCANNKGVSIGLCTVDGTAFTCGENSYFPLHGSIFPFVYALAAHELGRPEMQKLVSFEQVGENEPTGTAGLPKALSKSGILMVLGALLSRGSWGNSGRSSVEKLLELLGAVAGGRRIQSSLSSFLSLRDNSHQDYSIAHGLKATGHLPVAVDVRDLLDVFFAANSVEIDCQVGGALAVVLAAEGVSTHNNQKIFEPPLVRALLELLRPVAPGSNLLTTTTTSTPTIFLCLPKVLGLVVHTSSEGQAIEITKNIAKKMQC